MSRRSSPTTQRTQATIAKPVIQVPSSPPMTMFTPAIPTKVIPEAHNQPILSAKTRTGEMTIVPHMMRMHVQLRSLNSITAAAMPQHAQAIHASIPAVATVQVSRSHMDHAVKPATVQSSSIRQCTMLST